MHLIALKETATNENRVAITPATVKAFKELGIRISIESGAGVESDIPDEEFVHAGAEIFTEHSSVNNADILLKVNAPSTEELSLLKSEGIVVGLLNPFANQTILDECKRNNISSFAMELMPRITRAQSMDVLSSQSNLAGYRSVIDASHEYNKTFPMFMTAAGTVTPAKVLVLGAGVAGLQAIATAKRLGAIVSAFDVRATAKEEVESLGAKFIEVDESGASFADKSGYAKTVTQDYKRKQNELITETLTSTDIAICTALIPGKPAPTLITKEMALGMKPGSIIVDLAAATGGNCELTKRDKVTDVNGIKVIGYTNYPSRVAADASKLYARNLFNFVKFIYNTELRSFSINREDEIIKATLLTHHGSLFFLSNKVAA